MLRALAIVVVGGVLLACALTPPVYSLLQSLMGEVPWPYSRVFDRVALLVVVVLVYVQRRSFQLHTLRPYYRDWRGRGEWKRMDAIGAETALRGRILEIIIYLRSIQQ